MIKLNLVTLNAALPLPHEVEILGIPSIGDVLKVTDSYYEIKKIVYTTQDGHQEILVRLEATSM